MFSLIVPIAAFLLGAALVIGVGFWFNRVQKCKAVERIGIEVMAARSWKEGLELLARSIVAEGGWRTENLASPQGQPTPERLLIQGGRRVLLVYKHGTSYRIGPNALTESARRRQDVGATELWIATLGTVEPEAQALADRTKVTLVDGKALWERANGMLEPRIRSDVDREAAESVKRPRAIAMLAIAAVALTLVIVSLPEQLPRSDIGGDGVTAPTLRPDTRPAVRPQAPAAQSGGQAAMDQDTLTARRAALAVELVDVDGVIGAAWASSTTVVISLAPSADIDAVFVKACTRSSRYAELTGSRLQFESGDPAVGVRWRRCG